MQVLVRLTPCSLVYTCSYPEFISLGLVASGYEGLYNTYMNYIWRIIRFTGSLWRYYAAIGFFTVSTSLMGLLQPLFSGWAIDELHKGTSGSIRYVAILAGLIFLTDFLSNIFNNINGYLGDQMSAKNQQILMDRYYRHLLSLPQSYFDTELSGKIINRLSRSINQIGSFLQAISNNFLQFIFSTIFALIFVFYYSWKVGLLLLSLYPLYIFLTVRTSGTWQAYQKDKNEQLDIANGRFAESIGQIKVVKSFIREAGELKFFNRHINKGVAINVPQSKFWHVRDVRRRSLLNIIFFGVYLLIFIGGVQGTYSPGVAVALILYSMQIRLPIFTISFLVDATQRAVADSRDYFEVLDVKPEITDHAGAQPLVIKAGRIVFDDVRFGYNDKEVLKGISFVVEPDSKIALVGESGEGKTTITNLLMRLYEPQSGTITIDDQNINDVTQTSLRKNIGVVFQDPALFSGTIRENIAYGAPKATKKEIQPAAKPANAHEFISGFEKGYDTEIGERGLKLSGGQKQRIAIARALLKDAPILILDEATSSLDSKSEVMVQEALTHLMKGRTTIIIAHRLSTIQSVDKIVTIKQGKVDETGTPAELAKTNGIYAQLLKLQNRVQSEQTREQLEEFDIAA
jgi:ATP-binding cassette subfamily B protein